MIQAAPNILYGVVMAICVTGWLALIFFPRRAWANFWFAGVAVPLILSLSYTTLLFIYWVQPPAAHLTQFLSLVGVYTMFGNPGILLVAWIDLVAIDLVVGAWMARKAVQIRMPYAFLLPCLIMTFVFVGWGFLMFAIFAAMKGGWGEMLKFEGEPPINSSPVFARPEIRA